MVLEAGLDMSFADRAERSVLVLRGRTGVFRTLYRPVLNEASRGCLRAASRERLPLGPVDARTRGPAVPRQTLIDALSQRKRRRERGRTIVWSLQLVGCGLEIFLDTVHLQCI